jgi:putative aldouronate transport system substrate-binding protein
MSRFTTTLLILFLFTVLISRSPVAAQEQTPSIEVFMRLTYPERPAPEEDWFWYETVRNALGFDVHITFATSNEDETAQLDLRRAMGDMPDLYFSESRIVDMTTPGLLADWTPFLDLMPEFMASRGASPQLQLLGQVDGQQLALMSVNDFVSGHRSVTVIRQDWLEALALEVPTTTEEFYEVMRAFTYDDPDGNGIDDTYGTIGLVGVNDTYTGFPSFYGAFNALSIWDIRDNQLVFVPATENRRQALEYVARLHADGLIYPTETWYTQTTDEYRAARDSGRAGIIVTDFCSLFCAANYGTVLASSGEGARFISIDPPIGPDGSQIVSFVREPVTYWAMPQATVDAGQGELVARFLNWLTTDGYLPTFYGQEGVNWAYNAEGVIDIVDAAGNPVSRPFTVADFQTDIQARTLASTGDAEELAVRYRQSTTYENGQTIVAYDILRENQQRPFMDYNFSPLLPGYNEVVSVATIENLRAFILQNELAFITGERSFEEWDAYVTSLMTGFDIETYLQAAQPVVDVYLQEQQGG